ncbi:class I SAM-dependent methyltransferase [Salinirubrum litoreum]|uniref:Class I SAM-dependent methyltransferase n=1 Tax=Salinirubrum litoreum TaxID=1126234 RepID=A0ABD5RCG0_9EURY|nr:class I SAM-dependent methyltransferase [Salinirubrum litoreum]
MVDKQAVQRGYDELAEQYDGWRERGGRGVDLLDDVLGALSPDARLLDAGCGGGQPVLARASETTDAVGLDFSGEQLRLAGEHAPTADRVQGDMTALPFAADSFDAVVAYWSVIHVPLADHQTVVDEFARVLRPGGRLLLCEGTTEWVGENPDWFDSGTGMAWEIAGAEATDRQLLSAGFAVTDRWGLPESLSDDADAVGENDDADAANEAESSDDPWTFFAARLPE